MRVAVLIFFILAAVLMAEAFDSRRLQPQGRPSGNFPTFPGQGPFNPRPRWPDAYKGHRFRRSPEYAIEDVAAEEYFQPEAQFIEAEIPISAAE